MSQEFDIGGLKIRGKESNALLSLLRIAHFSLSALIVPILTLMLYLMKLGNFLTTSLCIFAWAVVLAATGMTVDIWIFVTPPGLLVIN